MDGARAELTPDAVNYLNARLDEKDFHVYKSHVLEQRGGQGAYPIIVFARLVESACDRLKIPFNTGSSITKPQKMPNGPRISIAIIVQFYRQKFPSDSTPAPSTFGNHRSIYLRAKTCMVNLENRELSIDDQTFSRSLKKIFRTPLTELAVVQPEEYGSLNAFKTRIETLEKVYHKKPKAREN